MTTAAFLGLGAMGLPMARNVLRKGLLLRVWNRTPQKSAHLASEGGAVAATPREAAGGADVVCTMLADPAAVDEVASGPDGLLAGLGAGAVWLDFSTVTPFASRRFAAAAGSRGAGFCDVPVAGSVQAATDGTLTILAGGDPETLRRAGPVLAAVSQKVLRFGDVGQGSAMKLVNNLLFGVGLAAFGEALGLAKRLGLDDVQATEWLLSVPALAPYVRLKWEFLKTDPGAVAFRLALMQKDLRLAVESAGGSTAVPIVAAAQDHFARAASAGLGGKDMSAVIPFAAGAAGPPKHEPTP
jgi:3-hydroxyisobutyrate dehydrogenase